MSILSVPFEGFFIMNTKKLVFYRPLLEGLFFIARGQYFCELLAFYGLSFIRSSSVVIELSNTKNDKRYGKTSKKLFEVAQKK
jgi:hypothetical protein